MKLVFLVLWNNVMLSLYATEKITKIGLFFFPEKLCWKILQRKPKYCKLRVFSMFCPVSSL